MVLILFSSKILTCIFSALRGNLNTLKQVCGSDLNDLNKDSEIILMNASMKNLPDNFDDVLKDDLKDAIYNETVMM